jgi:hypothetical protein
MFRTRTQVEGVVSALADAAAGPRPPRLSLLAETEEAVNDLEDILGDLPAWVDHVHIGLNDLALARGSGFLFEPIATGEIAALARRVQGLGRRFGFGGVGMPGHGAVPAEQILGEHIRVGSSCVILSRAFHQKVDPDQAESLGHGIALVRRWEARWRGAPPAELSKNHETLCRSIETVLATR